MTWYGKGLTSSDRKSRYYGHQAGRITRQNRWVAWAACLLAVAEALTATEMWQIGFGVGWVLASGATSAFAAVQVAMGGVARAVFLTAGMD